MDVRRLAAIDMHGLAGSMLRRRIILWEFILGAVLGLAFGLFVLLTADSLFWAIFGLWLIFLGMNYVPLAIYAIGFTRPGALQQELAGVNIPAELRRYTGLQMWVFVPFALGFFAVRQR